MPTLKKGVSLKKGVTLAGKKSSVPTNMNPRRVAQIKAVKSKRG